jgi:predicted transcriptional regulator
MVETMVEKRNREPESHAKNEFGTTILTDFACVDEAISETPKLMKQIVAEAREIAKARKINMRYNTYYDHINDRLIASGFVEKNGDLKSYTYSLTAKGRALRAAADSRFSWIGADDADPDELEDNQGYIPDEIDRRELINRQICARRGRKRFRDKLLARFQNRCAITGCAIVDILEAAHISPYRGENDDHPTNGLLLRADIHTLFDLDLLGIEPDELRVELHPDICDEYGYLIGKVLSCPAKQRPSNEALQGRYLRFRKRKETKA